MNEKVFTNGNLILPYTLVAKNNMSKKEFQRILNIDTETFNNKYSKHYINAKFEVIENIQNSIIEEDEVIENIQNSIIEEEFNF